MNLLRAQKMKKALIHIVRFVLIVGLCFVILQPLLIMFSKAFMSKEDIFDSSVVFVPRTFTLFNVLLAAEMMDYWRALLNTVIYAGVTTVISTLSCLMVGYGLARFEFTGKKLVTALVILTIIIPPQLIMVPLFIRFTYFDVFGIYKWITGEQGINLIDTFIPSCLLAAGCMGIKNGIFIYMFRQFFKGIPKETEEAAMVDGAGPFRVFASVMVPQGVTMIVTVFLFSFVWQYNDTVFTTLFLKSTKVLSQTYSTFESFKVAAASNVEAFLRTDEYIAVLKSTGVMLMLIPLLILYFIMQRYFVEGIERSGVTG